MDDRIEIRDLLVRGILGLKKEEREKRQDIVVNLVLHTDTRAAAASDDVADAVNYRTVKHQVFALVEGSRFKLAEALADAIARVCLSDERVAKVEVTVEKPGALRFARSVAVTIERTREDL